MSEPFVMWCPRWGYDMMLECLKAGGVEDPTLDDLEDVGLEVLGTPVTFKVYEDG